MTRDEMIDVLIEDKISEWVYAHCVESLEEALFSGWKGLDDYTEEELKDAIEDWIDPEQVQELFECSKRRHKEQAERRKNYKEESSL